MQAIVANEFLFSKDLWNLTLRVLSASLKLAL